VIWGAMYDAGNALSAAISDISTLRGENGTWNSQAFFGLSGSSNLGDICRAAFASWPCSS
jgi:hypothetical protein